MDVHRVRSSSVLAQATVTAAQQQSCTSGEQASLVSDSWIDIGPVPSPA